MSNGSDELIQLLIMAFCQEGQSVVSLEPTFSEYMKLAGGLGRTYVGIAPNKDLSFDFEALLLALEKDPGALVFLCSPNNPTGQSLTKEDVEAVLSVSKNIVALDEAYVEYSSRQSLISLVESYPQLVVLRTLSKAYGLASLRVGYGVGQKGTIDALHAKRMPYNVSGLSARVAECTLDLVDLDRLKKEVDKERSRYCQLFDRLEIDYLPSDANFIMITPPDLVVLNTALTQAGLITRVFKEDLLTDRLRITIGNKEENDRVMAVIEEVISRA